jgi:acyl-coenzyme A synthetase/AMP-(fatty) acid ligase
MENKIDFGFTVQLTKTDYLDFWKASSIRHVLWILYLVAGFYFYGAFAVFMNEGYTKETASTIISLVAYLFLLCW